MLNGEDRIIARAVGGEASAFGLLYDHYQPQIYRFVLIKVSRREEAEDLTHQVFLHAFEHIGSYRDLGFPFSSWLYRIARNQVIDHYRTRKQTLSLEAMDPDQLTATDPVSDSLQGKLELERISRAVKKLKPEYQDVILMRFVEELSIKEVAAALEKTEGAVKLMQHRALYALRKLLGAS